MENFLGQLFFTTSFAPRFPTPGVGKVPCLEKVGLAKVFFGQSFPLCLRVLTLAHPEHTHSVLKINPQAFGTNPAPTQNDAAAFHPSQTLVTSYCLANKSGAAEEKL